MKEGFVLINSVPTHVFSWGQWIQDDFDESVKELVIVITGNPGLGGYYTSFCSTLHDELDKKVAIWLIGHAGHDEPKKELQMAVPSLDGNKDLYTLQGQVNHKVDFIKKFIPKNVKLHVVSHSIGSKITLELLRDDDINKQIHQCYLLFPTIEKMVESSSGSWIKFFDRIFFVLRFIYFAFNFLPLKVRTIILYIYCLCCGFPAFFLGTVIKTSSPTVLDKIWFMTKDEMEKVRDIDENLIRNNLRRIKFYYGTSDGWVPTAYYYDLLKRFPGIEAELCTEKIDHAFVISHGPRMARMVSDWIKCRLISKSL